MKDYELAAITNSIKDYITDYHPNNEPSDNLSAEQNFQNGRNAGLLMAIHLIKIIGDPNGTVMVKEFYSKKN